MKLKYHFLGQGAVYHNRTETVFIRRSLIATIFSDSKKATLTRFRKSLSQVVFNLKKIFVRSENFKTSSQL